MAGWSWIGCAILATAGIADDNLHTLRGMRGSPLLEGEGQGEVRDLSGDGPHLTPALSFQEREPRGVSGGTAMDPRLARPDGGRIRLPRVHPITLVVEDGATGAEPLRPVTIIDQEIPARLTGAPGDPARGRALVTDRTKGLCLLCHAGPFPEERFPGNIGPDLDGVGERLSPGALRLRLVDGRVLNPDTIMPSYYSLDGMVRVGAAWRGRPVLDPQEIEDIVAFLATLRDTGTGRTAP